MKAAAEDSSEEAASTEAELRPFSKSLPMALLRARESVMRHFRPSLQAAGLTEQQWRTLRALSSLQEIDVTGLATATFLLAPSLTRILRDMEARKLVRRRPDPGDGRVGLVSLTARGRSMLHDIGIESEATYRAIEAHIGADRVNRLMSTLFELEAELEGPLPKER